LSWTASSKIVSKRIKLSSDLAQTFAVPSSLAYDALEELYMFFLSNPTVSLNLIDDEHLQRFCRMMGLGTNSTAHCVLVPAVACTAVVCMLGVLMWCLLQL
jgi:hypothetical protein